MKLLAINLDLFSQQTLQLVGQKFKGQASYLQRKLTGFATIFLVAGAK